MVHRILIPLLILGATSAHAEFARWTSKDGKVAELELLKLEKKADAEMVTFRTRAGKTVTMNLADLQEAEWERARAAAAPVPNPAADKAPLLLEAAFQTASGQPPKPRKAGEEGSPARIEYLFSVRNGADCSYSALKAETLEMQPFTIGGKNVTAKNWKAVAGSNGTITLTASGNFDITKLSGSKISATVMAVAGRGLKSEKATIKVPKDESKPSYGKVGPFTVHVSRDVRQVTVGIDPKDRGKIVSYRLDGSPNNGVSVDLVKVEETVPVVVDYWEEIKEVPLKLEATAP